MMTVKLLSFFFFLSFFLSCQGTLDLAASDLAKRRKVRTASNLSDSDSAASQKSTVTPPNFPTHAPEVFTFDNQS